MTEILLADDDPDLLAATADALRREGYAVIPVTSGSTALRRFKRHPPDLVILDVSLPRLGGFEVCRHIRETSRVPVILLTAASDEASVTKGFACGADDYITKPSSVGQLAARIRAVLRRRASVPVAQPPAELIAGDLVLDIRACRVARNGADIPLTRREFRILHVLAENAGRVVSTGRIIESGWGHHGGAPPVLRTHISHLRTKLGLARAGSGSIRAVAGVGYVLTPTGATLTSRRPERSDPTPEPGP